MSNEITSTHEIAETEWDGGSEPQGVDTDMVATKDPEGKGIEFHVSMRDYTMADMETLIVEAAARMIVGKFGNDKLAKMIEVKCVELITAKADSALQAVSKEVIDQPMTPDWPGQAKQPVTMREFIGLYGREYLERKVTYDDKVQASYHDRTAPRLQHIVERYMDRAFKADIEKATSTAIREIQAGVMARHNETLAAEKARIRDALAKATQS